MPIAHKVSSMFPYSIQYRTFLYINSDRHLVNVRPWPPERGLWPVSLGGGRKKPTQHMLGAVLDSCKNSVITGFFSSSKEGESLGRSGMCTRPFRPRTRRDVNVRDQDETETLGTVSETRPRRCESETRLTRYKLPRRLVKSSKQSPQVAAYRDNWSGIRAKHIAFIISAFYGLVNAVVGLPHWRSQDFWLGGSCKFSPLTSFTLDDISHS